ncbi:hypothetical protein HanIR_Chr01g0040791 [Helianthus annuus]|nr:hypothetical protein HanIR_Chr01g0040791 [Helianthus annuus]
MYIEGVQQRFSFSSFPYPFLKRLQPSNFFFSSLQTTKPRSQNTLSKNYKNDLLTFKRSKT